MHLLDQPLSANHPLCQVFEYLGVALGILGAVWLSMRPCYNVERYVWPIWVASSAMLALLFEYRWQGGLFFYEVGGLGVCVVGGYLSLLRYRAEQASLTLNSSCSAGDPAKAAAQMFEQAEAFSQKTGLLGFAILAVTGVVLAGTHADTIAAMPVSDQLQWLGAFISLGASCLLWTGRRFYVPTFICWMISNIPMGASSLMIGAYGVLALNAVYFALNGVALVNTLKQKPIQQPT